MDFSLILFLLVCTTGVIWALDRWMWAGSRARSASTLRQAGAAEQAQEAEKEPTYVEYAKAFFPVILIVFLLRSFLVEPFRIPSGSMLPSLHIGDFIVVNKFAYGIRLPVINRKVVDLGAPKRGEVIVFRFPGDESVNYIKRVVGVPGDHITYEGKRLYVNGKLMPLEGGTPYRVGGEPGVELKRFTERLDGVSHDVLISSRPDPTPPPVTVPPGQYFVMGDNRDHSNDSRYWGYVPEENLVGKAFLIWFSWDASARGGWFWDRIVFERIGNTIH